MIIRQDGETYSLSVEGEDSEAVFIKGDIYEAKRLLEHIMYALGLNTDTHKINLKISGK